MSPAWGAASHQLHKRAPTPPLPPRYYFPTYENDALLCTLSDDEGTGHGETAEVPVIAEDIADLRALKQSSVLNQLLKHSSNRD